MSDSKFDYDHEAKVLAVCDEGSDYWLKIKLPNGKVVPVLIPKDVNPTDGPYGLNLVCYGHYQ